MKKTSIFLLFILVLSTTPLVNASEDSDWLGTWQNRITLTISSASIDEILTDFPVLLNISSSIGTNSANLTGVFVEVGADFNAIAITNSTHNQLYFEVEYWNHTENLAYVWFKAPTISNISDTVFYLYYDAEQDGAAYNVAANVWDTSFVMVQHMNDATTSSIMDSTSNDNDGAKKGANEPIEATGKIGDGQDFDGVDDKVTISDSSSIDLSELTISFWVKSDVDSNFQNILTKGTLNNANFGFRQNFDTNTVEFICWDTSITTLDIDSIVPVFDNTWKNVVGTYKKPDGKIFVDGILSNSASPNIDLPTNNDAIDIFYDNIYSTYRLGLLDELQISSVARSVAWVGASYESQSDNLFSATNFEVIPEEIILRSLVFMALSLAVTAIALVIVSWKERE